jgi:Leu/Phe-tRNA-protein transferase
MKLFGFQKDSLQWFLVSKKFNKCLNGKDFELHSDHALFTYVQNCKIENGRIKSWALELYV